MRRLLILFLVLTLSLHWIFAANSVNSYNSIPFEQASGLILVSASLNGEVGTFIFDTGADQLLINKSSTKGNSESDFTTINGEIKTQKFKISNFKIGQIEINDFQAFATDLSLIENHVGSRILGIIGAKMLDTEIMHINKNDRVIEFLHRKTLKSIFKSYSIRIPVVFENDVPIIKLHLGDNSYGFVLDTGSSISFIDENVLADKKQFFNRTDHSYSLLTASGEQKSNYYYECNALQIDGTPINDVRISPIDLSSMQAIFDVQISGIISLDDLPFSSLVLDYKNGFLLCNF